MKKGWKMLIFSAAAVLALGASALAADDGFYDLATPPDTLAITPQSSAGTVTSSEKNVVGDATPETIYLGSDRLEVTYTGTVSPGDYFVVMLVTGTGLPTAANAICYADQVTAEDADGVTFTVYPDLSAANGPLTLYLTSSREDFTTMSVGMNYNPAYLLGDVDRSGTINVLDATEIVNYVVGKRSLSPLELLIANVTVASGDSDVNILDAMEIINYVVGRPQYLVK